MAHIIVDFKKDAPGEGPPKEFRFTPEQISGELAQAGFNRASLGVQDFAPAVQDAIHRHQSFVQTRALITALRAHGFDDVNLDLVYVATHNRVVFGSPDLPGLKKALGRD